MAWAEGIDTLCQIQITVMTFVTPHLVASRDLKKRRLGFWCGLTSMPAWFFTASYPTLKWGLVICNLSYVIAYLRGLWTHRD